MANVKINTSTDAAAESRGKGNGIFVSLLLFILPTAPSSTKKKGMSVCVCCFVLLFLLLRISSESFSLWFHLGREGERTNSRRQKKRAACVQLPAIEKTISLNPLCVCVYIWLFPSLPRLPCPPASSFVFVPWVGNRYTRPLLVLVLLFPPKDIIIRLILCLPTLSAWLDSDTKSSLLPNWADGRQEAHNRT